MKEFTILGQKVTVGDVNADPYGYCDTPPYPREGICYSYTPTLFDGIQAVIDHNGGTFPTSNYDALYYNENYGDDPVFGIRVAYSDATHFNLIYGFRDWDGVSYNWQGFPAETHYYNDGYTGATGTGQHDRDRQGIWFAYMSEGLTFMPLDPLDRWVCIYQHFLAPTPYNIYIFNPETTSFDIEEGYPGDRYYPVTGPSYYKTTDGYTNCVNDGGIALVFECLADEITNYTEDIAEPGGGYGDYGYYSKKVGIPGLPGLTIMDTGAATMWCPTKAQIQALNTYLWTDDFFDNIKKINADPLANIIQFGVVPLDLAALRGTQKEVKVGNVGTSVQMYPLTSQYIQVDLGEVNPWERWGTSMDYEPNTRASIFLPFVGIVDVPCSEIFGKAVNIVYNIDLLSGDFVAFIRIHRNNLDSVLYHKTGNMMLSFPLSAANYSNLFKTVAAGVSGVVAGAATGNPGVIASSLGEMAGSIMSGGSSIQLQRTGNFSGASAALGCFEAYIILTQPEQQLPADYNTYIGYPSYITYKLSELSGFTKVEDVIDNTVAATDTEKMEIERLLKEGIIL